MKRKGWGQRRKNLVYNNNIIKMERSYGLMQKAKDVTRTAGKPTIDQEPR